MVQLASISNPLVDLAGVGRPLLRDASTPRCNAPKPSADSVELSDAAQRYTPPEPDDPAGNARIADIRSRIADGSLLNDDVMDVVVDRLYKDLFGAPAALHN
ncbi:hypothetical protein RAS1_21630 [Phycisphaerae bacterium RAS1]|nr:hypothetical protein RAS1_21630 [Phycisphaerae bacterium RAS1]